MIVDAQSGSYVAVGLLDGRVQFFSARRGVKVMEFKAHAKKVQYETQHNTTTEQIRIE